MIITKLETFHVRPRWLFLKVSTDEGISGWGEPVVEGRARTVETAVHEYERLLIGQDPRRIEHLWQCMWKGTFYRGGPVLTSAMSGIEQALWDILGKSLGVPVYQLLGGRVRGTIRVYAHLRHQPGEDTVACIKRMVREKQYTAYKWSPLGAMRMLESKGTIDKAVEAFIGAREAAGPEIDLAIDMHGRATPAISIQVARRLEPYHPLFIEEPVLPGDVTGLKRIADATSVPVATGERLFTRWQFQEIIEAHAVDVVQPDISHCGGIFEARKIAAMAESRNIAIAPHCPLGPITLAASLQLAACTPNFLCQEQVNLGEEYLKQPFIVEAGSIKVPEGPGLGIEVDEDRVRAEKFAGDWETPVWTLPDGSRAEW
jgi:galactonate dehydratase